MKAIELGVYQLVYQNNLWKLYLYINHYGRA